MLTLMFLNLLTDLLQVDHQNLLSTGLLQVVSTSFKALNVVFPWQWSCPEVYF